MEKILPFLAGCVCICNFVIALLFARFYRRTHDRLFIIFALSFALLGINSVLLLIFVDESVGNPYLFSIRLIAFLCIIFGILDKNRKSPTI